jgi:hypothetical protein
MIRRELGSCAGGWSRAGWFGCAVRAGCGSIANGWIELAGRANMRVDREQCGLNEQSGPAVGRSRTVWIGCAVRADDVVDRERVDWMCSLGGRCSLIANVWIERAVRPNIWVDGRSAPHAHSP